MKYFLILFIALGLVLSHVAGIEYRCSGPEVFPTYYGSPFVFKKESLASSMENYYSISGLVLNVFIWSLLVYGVHRLWRMLVFKLNHARWLRVTGSTMVVLLMLLTICSLFVNGIMLARGFDAQGNYWFWDMDQEVAAWGMRCEGHLVWLAW